MTYRPRQTSFRTFILLVVALSIPAVAAGQVPETIAYQGYLTDAEGEPLEGPVDLTFRLYDAATEGSAVWAETHGTVPLSAGVVSVRLGTVESLEEIAFDSPLWLAVHVDGGEELAPRMALAATPYALSLRGLRVRPAPDPEAQGPSVIGGWSGNLVDENVAGATIAGGGRPNGSGSPRPNQVSGSYGTVGGGWGNDAIGDGGTVGGGHENEAGTASVVSGGAGNQATGSHAAVPGGSENRARGDFSFAAGFNARAIHTGSFVWSDRSAGADSLVTTGDNQFLIRAAGGVGIGTNAPSAPLTVAGLVESTEGGFKLPDGTILNDASDVGGGGADNTWQLGGNEAVDPETQYLGTSDPSPLELRVNATRVLRLEPGQAQAGPNVIAGSAVNNVDEGVVGATISGGGDPDFSGNPRANEVTGEYGTIGGGSGNSSGIGATVGGGFVNIAAGGTATIAGGIGNEATGARATIGGGINNVSTGAVSTLGGGSANEAAGTFSTIGGGRENAAGDEYATVGGGEGNVASARHAMVPGGRENVAGGRYSFAAGHRAIVRDADATGDNDGDQGTFVWADSGFDEFISTGSDQFLIRAGGGVGIGTNAPTSPLTVDGVIESTAGGFMLPDGTVIGGADDLGGGGSSSWQLGGNSGTDADSDFIGTTDDIALELRVNAARIARYEPETASEGPNVIAGYSGNTAADGLVGVTIAGGGDPQSDGGNGLPQPNTVTGNYGTIGGGRSNTVSGGTATVAGGVNNEAGNENSTIAGGASNSAGGNAATIGGGVSNAAQGFRAAVSGGQNNEASGGGSVVGGGSNNTATGESATIGGGIANEAGGLSSTIAGGDQNVAGDNHAVVAGGLGNDAAASRSAVGGGQLNRASGISAVVSGGNQNTASGQESTVAGGSQNTAGGAWAGVAAGFDNTASGGNAAIGGGAFNRAAGTGATVPGGSQNHARGHQSFAAGTNARAAHAGTFVWSDNSQSLSDSLVSTASHQFLVRATGGMGIGTNKPGSALHVAKSVNASASVTNHVALIENTSAGTSNGPDVLALKSSAASPNSQTNFITFFNGSNSGIGAIEGTGTGITLKSGSADFAERLKRLDPSEHILPAEVVGVHHGKITKRTTGSERVMVVSDRAIVIGNVPTHEDDVEATEVVAFVGQVPVRVTGPVRAGDVLVASGKNDGRARGIPSETYHPSTHGHIVGRAWSSTTRDGEVIALVGLDEAGALANVVQRQQEEIEMLQAQVNSIRSEVASLRSLLNQAAAMIPEKP